MPNYICKINLFAIMKELTSTIGYGGYILLDRKIRTAKKESSGIVMDVELLCVLENIWICTNMLSSIFSCQGLGNGLKCMDLSLCVT